MATHKYISRSDVSLTVRLANGGNMHVKFVAKTGGGSVFYTTDESLALALSKHPKFGKLFKEVAAPAPVKPAEPKIEEKKSDIKKVKAACVDDAKDYLSLHYGVSRTKMRSTKAIKEVAKTYNIEFEGI